MLNIPEDFFIKLMQEVDLSTTILSGVVNIDNEALDIVLAENDPKTILRVLKMKLFMLFKTQSVTSDYDLHNLIKNARNGDLYTFHQILFHALLIQESINQLKHLLLKTYNYLKSQNEHSTCIFELEILDVVMEVCLLINENLIINFDEEKELQNLILRLQCSQEKNVQKKMSMDIIPKYFQNTKNTTIFSAIWDEIQNSSDLEKLEKLIALQDYFIPQNYDEINFTILDMEEFWLKLQTKITSESPPVKKQAIYLLKRAINTLFTNQYYLENFTSEKAPVVIKWDENQTENNKIAWKNFFILCDTSSEKQLHLIEPTFKLYFTLKNLHNSWKICVTKLFIYHPHSAVVRNTILNVLSNKWLCDIDTLIYGLNNIFLYEDSKIDFCLNDYVTNLSEENFEYFAKTICTIKPSPIPLYYICTALKHFKLSKPNFKIVSNLVHLSENTPHLYIRKAIQHSLFIFLTETALKFENFQGQGLLDLVKIVSLFNKIGYLTRDNEFAWRKAENWINDFSFDVFSRTEHYKNVTSYPRQFAVLYAIYDIKSGFEFLRPSENIKTFEENFNEILFLCHIMNLRKTNHQIVDSISTAEDLDFLIGKFFQVLNCLQENKFSLEFFEKVEFILDMFLTKADIMESFCSKWTEFLDNIWKGRKYILYLILSRKVITAYSLIRSKKSKSGECHEEFYCKSVENTEINLKKVKNNLETEGLENSIKRKVISDYYNTKLNIIKLLFEIHHNNFDENKNIFGKILVKVNKYFDKGGPDILPAVIDVLYAISKHYQICKTFQNFGTDFRDLLERCQKEFFNLRTNELFRPAMSKFIEILVYQMAKQTDFDQVRTKFCQDMFVSDQSLVSIRLEILLQFRKSVPITEILAEALLYGPTLRKDQRIEFDTCALISEDEKLNYLDLPNPCELDGRVRSEAVCLLLNLMSKENGKQICNNILEIILKKYEESAGKRYFGDSQIHFLKLRVMQALHVMLPTLNNENLNKLIPWLFNCLVKESQQPSVKLLIQWLLIRVFKRLKLVETSLLDLISKIKQLPGKSATCVFPIFYHLFRERRENTVDFAIVDKVMDCLLTHSMGQNFSIRYYAQVTVKHIYESFSSNEDFKQRYSLIYSTVCDVIAQTILSEKQNFELKVAYIPVSPALETIYYDIPRLTNVSHTEWLPVSYFRNGVWIKIKKSKENIKNISAPSKKIVSPIPEEDFSMNVQKKIDLMSNFSFSAEKKSPNGNLIVVASLIDRAPNLGGLSRTCEVFGVKQYVLNNKLFVENKEYQSLSMSSENWVDTIEVKISDLPTYLREMKRKGYSLVGAEQTADSKPLDNFQFNKNTLLLLGNEKEGVPPNLINLLDNCIEIPQFGQIRSLNVHVAGALFIWEYAKQHCQNHA